MQGPQERWIQGNGLRLRALEWRGVGPPVLLLHATSFCAEVWTPVWRAAREAGAGSLHALALDQRGHGASEAPAAAAGYGWPRLAEDLIASVEVLGEGPGLLFGHSSGGTACLAAAGMRPDLCTGVAVVEPVLFEAPVAGEQADSFAGSRVFAASARRRRARFEDRDVARSYLAKRFPYSGFAAESLDAYLTGGFEEREEGDLALRCTPEHEAWAYEGAARLDLWPLVARIEAPLLVVGAEHSAMPGALLERLRGSVQDVRSGEVAGATHFATLERPKAVGAILGRFAREVAGS